MFEIAKISIGGRFGSSPQSLKGAISSLELYVGDVTRKGDDGVPDALKQLIISSQLIGKGKEPTPTKKVWGQFIEKEDEPPAKKKNQSDHSI